MPYAWYNSDAVYDMHGESERLQSAVYWPGLGQVPPKGELTLRPYINGFAYIWLYGSNVNEYMKHSPGWEAAGQMTTDDGRIFPRLAQTVSACDELRFPTQMLAGVAFGDIGEQRYDCKATFPRRQTCSTGGCINVPVDFAREWRVIPCGDAR
mmetsp:Transcript_57828/g.167770  ORF Transcript_57828/g.167770 Transcript_57828/m.167770 type:complete len:153 (+) Transcript_57828:2-460(+)